MIPESRKAGFPNPPFLGVSYQGRLQISLKTTWDAEGQQSAQDQGRAEDSCPKAVNKL